MPGLADELNANTATFADNESMLTDLQQLKELYDAGYIGENALSDTYTIGQRVFSSGEDAMILANLTFPQQVENDYPDMKADTIGLLSSHWLIIRT